MTTLKHAALGAAVGAVAAIAPDLVLFTFGWRREWVPETSALVRLHRLLHDPAWLIPVCVALGWASHVIADLFSTHRTGP